MRVLLVEPRYGHGEALTWIPIGKGYLATQARRLGADVLITDRNLPGRGTEEHLTSLLNAFKPDIVGTGGMTLQWTDTKRVAGIVRRERPEALTIAGGVHLTALPDDGLGVVDLVTVGEGEVTFREVCRRWMDTAAAARHPRRAPEEFSGIDGLVYRSSDGSVSRAPRRDFVWDLDSLGLPSYDLLDVMAYHDHLVMGERGISVMTGRGCPFNCTFCASPLITQRRVRNFSLEFVFDQMRFLEETYGFKNFRIMDDTFAASRSRVERFTDTCREQGLGYNFNCLTHVSTSDQEMFERMRSAGFSVVAFGIESACDRVLKIINKGTTKERAARALRESRSAGVVPEALFMIGNIGDTAESVEETIEFAGEHNKPVVAGVRRGFNWFQFATPFPGSKFYDCAAEHGEVLSRDFDDYTHQRPVYVPRGLTVEKMIELRALGLGLSG